MRHGPTARFTSQFLRPWIWSAFTISPRSARWRVLPSIVLRERCSSWTAVGRAI